MTDTTTPAPEPKRYTDEVAPMPHWGDPVITMDALIKAHLAEGQRMHGWQTERMHAAFAFLPGDKSAPAQLASARMLVSTLGFLMSCVEASLLMEVQMHLTPEQADEFAAAHVSRGDSGDYYPEMLWDWLVDRGIDPERINAQVVEEIAAQPDVMPEPAEVEWGVAYAGWPADVERVHRFRDRDECERYIANPPLWSDRQQRESFRIVRRIAATMWEAAL